jgi:hypothetical protein
VTESHEARLAAAGIELPGPFFPHDPLDGLVVHGGRARTSGQLPRDSSCTPACSERRSRPATAPSRPAGVP